MKYRLFIKKLSENDVEVVESLPTDKEFTQSREFNDKKTAIQYVIEYSTQYIIREDKETEVEQKTEE